MTNSLFVQGPNGLGDCIYQRAALNALVALDREPLYVRTPWPEILPPGCLPTWSDTELRTQSKHARGVAPGTWHKPPNNIDAIALSYNRYDLAERSILETFALKAGVRPAHMRMDLPRFAPFMDPMDCPIAVVRPVTVRAEWVNTARNPDPQALYWVMRELRKTHYVVLVADLAAQQEWTLGDLPPHDRAFLNGELSFADLFGLCQQADVLVGGVGWIVPFALATYKRALVLLGGNGGHNSPDKIVGPVAPPHRIQFIYPENFCGCDDLRHDCQKYISKQALTTAMTEFRACPQHIS